MRPLEGGTYIFTSTAMSFHSIDKPFEMVSLVSVMERQIFLYDHRGSQTWDFEPWNTNTSQKTHNFRHDFPIYPLDFLMKQ